MKIAVLKHEDDPIAIRISIGGFKQAGNNAYITYRGDLEQVKLLLTAVTKEFTKLKKEPEVSDNGKKYA
jgi:hypothetical protein